MSDAYALGAWAACGDNSDGVMILDLRVEDATHVYGVIGDPEWAVPHGQSHTRAAWERYTWVTRASLNVSDAPRYNLAMLRGLMDCSGFIGRGGSATFSSSDRRNRDLVGALASSLGAHADKWERKPDGGPPYSTSVNTRSNPFLLPRKAVAWTPGLQRYRGTVPALPLLQFYGMDTKLPYRGSHPAEGRRRCLSDNQQRTLRRARRAGTIRLTTAEDILESTKDGYLAALWWGELE